MTTKRTEAERNAFVTQGSTIPKAVKDLRRQAEALADLRKAAARVVNDAAGRGQSYFVSPGPIDALRQALERCGEGE